MYIEFKYDKELEYILSRLEKSLMDSSDLFNIGVITCFNDILDKYDYWKYCNNLSNSNFIPVGGMFSPKNKTIFLNYDSINDFVKTGQIEKSKLIYFFINALLHELTHVNQIKNELENDSDISKFLYYFTLIETKTTSLMDHYYHFVPSEREANFNSNRLLINYCSKVDSIINIKTPINVLIDEVIKNYNVYTSDSILSSYTNMSIDNMNFSNLERLRLGISLYDLDYINLVDEFISRRDIKSYRKIMK